MLGILGRLNLRANSRFVNYALIFKYLKSLWGGALCPISQKAESPSIMVIVINLMLLLTLSSLVIAQNMDRNSKQPASKKTPSEITKMLKEDSTDELLYVNGRFYCHNFASTLYLRRSSLVTTLDSFDLNGINTEWGVVINRLAESLKMPIYYVALSNVEHGFYHAINAVLVNPDKPEEISSYVFIEPQTDETFLTAREVYDRYKSYYDKKRDVDEVLKLSINTFDAFKKSESGTIYQSFTGEKYSFDLRFF